MLSALFQAWVLAAHLVVANTGTTASGPGSISVFNLPALTLVHSFSNLTGGLCNPAKLLPAKTSYYVLVPSSNCGEDPGSIQVYPAESTAPSAVIGGIDPLAMALDEASGRLYVSQTLPEPSVSVYADSATPIERIRKLITAPNSLAIDGVGRLFVANCPPCLQASSIPGNVAVFNPGDVSPARIIRDGIDEPRAIATDRFGRLYVVDQAKKGSVSIYYADASRPYQKIIGFWPVAVASGGDYFFVARCPLCYGQHANGSVEAFDLIKGINLTIFSRDLVAPVALAVDSSGTVFVADKLANRVLVFRVGGSEPIAVITKDIHAPSALTIVP